MPLIAGRLDVVEVVGRLSRQRAVFHSEADFQFAFAQTVATLDASVRVRLEVPKRTADRRTYVDLACSVDAHTTLVEFKYVTRGWTGIDGITDEPFALRAHAALDLARLHFIHDITRLEDWTQAEPNTDGIAIMLTNDSGLWQPPSSPPTTRDRAYRIHEGITITGDLTWGTPEEPYTDNNRLVRGAYLTRWADYSHLDNGPGGRLRWLAIPITASHGT
jgi:hypothetical protein